ncbi:hypothetical protein QYE76_033904 [Lolium multiflorum]|uniref:Uncharacterized protein n=1 Tax=Lolium multiflorum TaxID=4521 RepID=A0AAD8QWM1_LOLMU|nr:hypothetical protein QYE76_033904 [Lolium multiflorum]
MESSPQDHPRPPPRRTSTVRGRRPGIHHPRRQGNQAQLPPIYRTTRTTDSKSDAFRKVTAQCVAAARSKEQRFSPGERKNSRRQETKLPDEALNRENGTQGHRQHRHQWCEAFAWSVNAVVSSGPSYALAEEVSRRAGCLVAVHQAENRAGRRPSGPAGAHLSPHEPI